jgi:hypothetical protein
MDPSAYFFIGYVDGVSYYSQNLASTTWDLFTPSHSLIHSNYLCIIPATNNQDEYDDFIGFLFDAIEHHIRYLHVCLYLHLHIMQLNRMYHVHERFLFRKYLQDKLLVWSFESISFSHVPNRQNNCVDTIENNILDRNLTRAYTRS